MGFDKISAKSLPLEKEKFTVRVMYSLLQQKIDDYGEIVQRIERKTIGFEEIPIGRTSPQFLEETFHFKKEIQKIISNLWHFNQILHNLKENSDIFKKFDNHPHNLEILQAESDYMFETAKNTRESLISLIELQAWGVGVENAPVFRPGMNRTPPVKPISLNTINCLT